MSTFVDYQGKVVRIREQTVYQKKGYEDRHAYLRALAHTSKGLQLLIASNDTHISNMAALRSDKDRFTVIEWNTSGRQASRRSFRAIKSAILHRNYIHMEGGGKVHIYDNQLRARVS